jgi:hypothetical protein
MTESELKTLLIALQSRKDTSKPSHEIIISFESQVEDLNDIDRFVTATQTRLDKINAGTLDIFGVDDDGSSGEFLIRCNEPMNVEDVYHEIRPILDDYNFFDYSYVVLRIHNSDGEYKPKFEYIKEVNIPEDNDPELPIPAGVNLTESTGCLGQVALLLSIGFILIGYYY